MGKTMPSGRQAPDDVEVDKKDGDPAVHFLISGIGAVTVDYMTRLWSLGLLFRVYQASRRPCNDQRYTGRGWRERIEDDAIKALRGVSGGHQGG